MKLFNALALSALTAIALTSSAHAATVSDGATPASGDTIVNMTVPKFAEIKDVPAAWAFTVTPAMYQSGYAPGPMNNSFFPNVISFFVRTNSTAGAQVKVNAAFGADGRNTRINPGDIRLQATGDTIINGLVSTNPSNLKNFTAQVLNFPTAPNVVVSGRIGNINHYHVGPSAQKDFTNTLVFSVLPN